VVFDIELPDEDAPAPPRPTRHRLDETVVVVSIGTVAKHVHHDRAAFGGLHVRIDRA